MARHPDLARGYDAARVRGILYPAAEHRQVTVGGAQHTDRVRPEHTLVHPCRHSQAGGGDIAARGSHGSLGGSAEVSAGGGQFSQFDGGKVALILARLAVAVHPELPQPQRQEDDHDSDHRDVQRDPSGSEQG